MKYDFLNMSKSKLNTALSEKQLREKLDVFVEENYSRRDDLAYSGARAEFADVLDIPPQFVSAVMSGNKKPTQPMLDKLGYEKQTVTFYTKRKG